MNIPKSLQFHYHDPDVKRVWAIDFPEQYPNACKNCGGTQTIMIFCATDGPFQSPGNPYLGGGKDPKSSKFIDGKWWVGHAFSAPCPACKEDQTMNEGAAKPNEIARESEVADVVESVIDKMQKKRKDIYD